MTPCFLAAIFFLSFNQVHIGCGEDAVLQPPDLSIASLQAQRP